MRIFTAETAVLQRKSPRWALQRTVTGLENASTSLTVRPLLTALSLSKGHQPWLAATRLAARTVTLVATA